MKLIKQRSLVIALVALCVFGSPTLNAQDRGEIAVTAGVIGLWDNESNEDFSAGIEWRAPVSWEGIVPWVGVAAASSNEFIVGGGLMFRFEINDKWRGSAGSGPFYYKRGNTSRDLGSSLEFYSFVEVTRRITERSDLGMRIGHISNAGLSEFNPGTEVVAVVWTFSL